MVSYQLTLQLPDFAIKMATVLCKWLIFGLVVRSCVLAAEINDQKPKVKSVAVIGAGPSGLTSAKYGIEQGLEVTVYEQSNDVGGVWQYTDRIGKNRFGVQIHSAMYQNLRYVVGKLSATINGC